jgi:hypothetical protein
MGYGLGLPLRKSSRIMGIGMKSSMAHKNNVVNLLRDTNNYVSSPICSSKFYQIGVESTKLMNLALEMSSLYEWAGPTPEDGNLSPPHLKIYMATECTGESSILTHCEMGVIMSAFYSRVYEPGYEGHSIFPVSFLWRALEGMKI